jgi:L-threonylcarbamoyladenylate synthase
VDAQLGTQIPYILDGGACAVGLESTIVGMEGEQVVIYRLGGLDLSKIEAVVGAVTVQAHSSSNPSAPGQLASHYAPRKPFVVGNLTELIPQLIQQGKEIGVLSFSTDFPAIPAERQVVLSATQDLQEAAQRLFMGMRLLDESAAAVILAEFVPEIGLGRAIIDRLKRAAAQPIH